MLIGSLSIAAGISTKGISSGVSSIQSSLGKLGGSVKDTAQFWKDLSATTGESIGDLKNLSKQGSAVFDQTRTAAEKYKTKLAELDRQLKVGAIDQDTFNRAAKLYKPVDPMASRGNEVFDQTRTSAEKYRSKLAELKDLLAKGAISQDTYNRAVRDLKPGPGLASLAVGLTALVGLGVGFGAWITSATKGLNALSQTAERAGVSVNTLKGLQFAAKASGNDVDAFTGIVAGLNGQLAQASTDGGSDFAQGLRNIGLSAKELVHDSPEVALGRISDALAGIADPGQRAYATTKLFGEEGLKLSRTLGLGSAGLRDYIAESTKLNGSVNGITTDKIAESNKAFAALGEAIEGCKTAVLVGLTPTVTVLAQQLAGVGTTGNSAFQSIGAVAGGYLIPTIGAVADVVHTLGLAFQVAQIIATKSFQDTIDGLSLIPRAFDKVKNAITGGNEESAATSFLRAYSAELDATTKKQLTEFNRALQEAPPSDKIRKFYADIQVAADKAALASNKAADAIKKSGKLPGTIGGGKALATVSDKINTLTRDLVMSGQKIGRNESFSKLYDLKNSGASDKQLFGVSMLMRQNDLKQDVASKNQETLNSGPQTRLGQYAKVFSDFGKATKLFREGAISEEDYAVAKLGKNKDLIELNQENMTQPAKFASSAELGTTEAYSSILQQIRGGGKNSISAAQLEVAKQQLDFQKLQYQQLYKVLNTTPPSVTLDVL